MVSFPLRVLPFWHIRRAASVALAHRAAKAAEGAPPNTHHACKRLKIRAKNDLSWGPVRRLVWGVSPGLVRGLGQAPSGHPLEQGSAGNGLIQRAAINHGYLLVVHR